MLQGKTIILGVTGSIAAVETVKLARELIRHGAFVQPLMSPDGCSIIHPNALQFASGTEPIIDIDGSVPYVDLCGKEGGADLLLIAPCTTNTLSKIASGIGDTPVTLFAAAAMGSSVPIILAPAAHITMYDQPIVRENVKKLTKLGVEFVGPVIMGSKARMASVDEIVAATIRKIGPNDMRGKSVVVIAGSTYEPIDDVRGVTNLSSGGTGIELARNAYYRGADVTLWLGGHTVEPPTFIDTKQFTSTKELLSMAKRIKCDICAVPAAIADYSPAKERGKIPSGRKSLTLKLSPTPKILDAIRARSNCYLLGFKAESNVSKKELIARAESRMKESKLDGIVANDIRKVSRESTTVYIITKRGEKMFKGSKAAAADEIWSAVLDAGLS